VLEATAVAGVVPEGVPMEARLLCLIRRHVAGLLALNLTTSSVGTAVGLSGDLATGVVDRFRALAMWRPAVLVGRSLADLLTATLCASWVSACIGISSKGPESAQGIALVLIFPLAFVSNSLVPTERMPDVLRTIADWNPVSAVTAAGRQLFGNPNPSAAIQDWPMQHPVLATEIWSVALIAIFAPLASVLYRRRTTD
jgi:hypothetical protein